ncbi:MAG TPA: FtsW/RodA/SpoVE family cell cycle protein [Candidatus Dormibacteraeota bacterium]|nr:FtsW/RodA/SpoVE family cell cycle protein [Candidatus Dormibacteraeota bacterium]
MLAVKHRNSSARPWRARRELSWLAGLDPIALLAVAGLVAAGLLNLYAIGEPSLALHQLVAVLAGLVLLLGLRRMNVRSLPLLGRTAYVVALLMLLAVFVAGSRAYGARRWLAVGSVVIQPSELAKLGLLMVLADVLGSGRPTVRRVLVALLLAAPPIGLTLLQPDLSTSLLLSATVVAMLLLARVPLLTIAALMAAVGAMAPLGLRLLRPYQLARLDAFLHGGSSGSSDASWSLIQSHVAIASGGLFGVAREPVHLLMAQYLPARQNDLAYASLVEEWGLLAGGLVLFAALLLVWRLAAASVVARTRPASLVAAGLGILFGIEAVVSGAGNLGLLPLAGVPFPLVSYGGTAAAAHLAALGLVLSARRDAGQRRLWAPPSWARRHPRLTRTLAMAVAAQVVLVGTFTWHLQASNGSTWRSYGQAQMTRCVRLPAARGVITDRHGTPLVVNVPESQVLVAPALLISDSGRMTTLAHLLGLSVEQLRGRLQGHQLDLALDVANVPSSVASRIQAANLPGVVVVPSLRQQYPYGALLGPLLGFTGIASPQDMAADPSLPLGAVVGKAGLQLQYDALLRGGDGEECFYVDPTGRPVAVQSLTEPVPGSTLRLSLDLGLQQAATAALASVMHGIAGQAAGDLGAVVVMDPRTGAILAMASLPSYDDNVYGPPADLTALQQLANAPGDPLLEHATQVAAPPGSTFKLVVAAADAVFNAIPPAQVIPTGYTFSFGGHTFHGWGPLPPQNLSQAIAWSNDVYFYKLALALGPDRIHQVGAQLGVGRPTGIDLPGENPGFLGTPDSVARLGETWYPGATVILGIGQGYVVATPLQDACWTAAVTTGVLPTPHLGLAYEGDSGQFIALTSSQGTSLPFANGLDPVRAGMLEAATSGTAAGLGPLPMPVGAKTGSAEDPGAPGTHVDAWYTAAAPLDHPEVVVTAFIRGGGEGNLTALPVVRDVLRYYFANRDHIQSSLPAVPPFPSPGA